MNPLSSAPTNLVSISLPYAQPAVDGQGKRVRLPPWLKVSIPHGETYQGVRARSHGLGLHTVCEEARCPNIGECWQGGTATFMLLGDTCTRGCRFCAIKTHRNPSPPDPEEPEKIVKAVEAMELDYVVLTTVTRDDLPDQGAQAMARVVFALRKARPTMKVEILIPDFRGDTRCLDTVLAADPHVLAHNLETVQRTTPLVRDPRANYRQSMEILAAAAGKSPRLWVKTSLMLGVGETEQEVLDTMAEAHQSGVSLLTLGQYLSPGPGKLPVTEYVLPQTFARLEHLGLNMGFRYVASGPLVRSSYRAGEHFVMGQKAGFAGE
ncbi:MAG: lipoyl synthase [Deltaproteobacteria bacterium]|nr:lipoyl synthase [Deltaproteobacteria bacterium]